MVAMTHPQVGNYSVASSGDESVRPWVSAVIVREPAAEPHHWDSHTRLEDCLQEWNVPGLHSIDTRALVPRLRETGTQRGVLRHSGEHRFTASEVGQLRAGKRSSVGLAARSRDWRQRSTPCVH
jgi:carbamoylphosphate synthase small subunit